MVHVSTFDSHVIDRALIHSSLASQDFIFPDWFLYPRARVPRAYHQVRCTGPGEPTKQDP